MRSVLIVDDDENIVDMLRQTFEQEKFEVFKAYDGVEALKVLAEREVHLVICDIMMPGRDGLELIQETHKKFPDAKIIAITGGGVMREDLLLKMAGRFGAHKTFMKPFYPADLVDAARELLESAA